MYSAIIVEDEQHSRDFLQQLLHEYCPQLRIVDTAANVAEGQAAIATHQPDIVFLDIEMPNGTGFDLLQHFPQPAFDVIFTTAYDHYAIKAIRFSAVDYLLKPIEIRDLQQAVNRVIENRQKASTQQTALQALLRNLKTGNAADQTIALSTGAGIEYVPLSQIIRVEASGPYSYFHLTGGRQIIVSRTLKEFELLLCDHGFMRVHNSHIINMDQVARMVKSEGGYVVLRDGAQIALSPRKRDEFLAAMASRSV